jgi:protein PhnA
MMMNVKDELLERSGGICELCECKENLTVYPVPPFTEGFDESIIVCKTCHEQITGAKPMDPNHWRALNNTMWNTDPAVQVMVWRTLHALRHEGWPQDLLDMLYLTDEVLAWAKGTDADESEAPEQQIIHKDSNGATLTNGDTVVLIKDLDVKGGGFTAKRGTAVRGISLVDNNPEHIEGRVNGQQIVILTKYVKKA